MHENDDLEIQRTDLANVALILKCLGVKDLSNFDFMDPPSNENLLEALKLLNALGILENDHTAGKRFHMGNVGDHIGLLNVYDSWKETNFFVQWCDENYIYAKSMKRTRYMRDQLEDLLKIAEIEVTSNKNDLEAVKKGHNISSYPSWSSSLGKVLPRWVVYHELVLRDSKKYMMQVTELKPEWLVDVAPHYYSMKMLKNEG
ncbi:OLC1v1038596C1 [Oldenlandia corymbosa var. corymbosa]|uniref:RNA helicase n=1 Tax=Oldenlandia corymbosa var. corymbosa TaxID=529605 RepID=A0AAV1D180_OLDCO|nr:OLC1v1038596C1 [Oldenlandia corymbosa var. corymbosa]